MVPLCTLEQIRIWYHLQNPKVRAPGFTRGPFRGMAEILLTWTECMRSQMHDSELNARSRHAFALTALKREHEAWPTAWPTSLRPSPPLAP